MKLETIKFVTHERLLFTFDSGATYRADLYATNWWEVMRKAGDVWVYVGKVVAPDDLEGLGSLADEITSLAITNANS